MNFNKTQDKKLSISVTDYWRLYGSVLKQFAMISAYSSPDAALQCKMRIAGLSAIQSVAVSQLFLSPDVAAYLKRIIPAIMVSLKDFDRKSPKTKINTDSHLLSVVEELASICLHEVGQRATASTAKYLIGPVFRFFDEVVNWSPTNLVVEVMRAISNSLQPRYRYLLVSSILSQLSKASPREPATIVTQLKILDTLTSDPGVSVLEICDALCSVLEASIMAQNKTPSQVDQERQVQEALAQVLVSLSLQPHSLSQFPDLLAFLLTKLSLPPPPRFPPHLVIASPDASQQVDSRKVLLRSLRKMAYQNRNNNHTPTIIVPVVVAALSLCTANDPESRILAMEFVTEVINGESAIGTTPLSREVKLAYNLTAYLYHYLTNVATYLQEFAAAKDLLLVLYARLKMYALVATVPVLLALQCRKDVNPAVHTIIAEYLKEVGRSTQQGRPVYDYADEILSARTTEGSHMPLRSEESTTILTAATPPVQIMSSSLVFDHDKLLTMLSEIHNGADTSPDLQAKLRDEYIPAEYWPRDAAFQDSSVEKRFSATDSGSVIGMDNRGGVEYGGGSGELGTSNPSENVGVANLRRALDTTPPSLSPFPSYPFPMDLPTSASAHSLQTRSPASVRDSVSRADAGSQNTVRSHFRKTREYQATVGQVLSDLASDDSSDEEWTETSPTNDKSPSQSYVHKTALSPGDLRNVNGPAIPPVLRMHPPRTLTFSRTPATPRDLTQKP